MECARTGNWEVARVQFPVDIARGPEVAVNGITHRGRTLLVDRAKLTYEPGEGGVWECKVFHATGKLLSKSGEEVTHTSGESLYGPMAGTCQALPEWAERIAEHYRPREPVPQVPEGSFSLAVSEVPG